MRWKGFRKTRQILWVNNWLCSWCLQQGFRLYNHMTFWESAASWKRQDPPYLVGQKCLSRWAGQLRMESWEHCGSWRFLNTQVRKLCVEASQELRVIGTDGTEPSVKQGWSGNTSSIGIERKKCLQNSITREAVNLVMGNWHTWNASTLIHAEWGMNSRGCAASMLEGFLGSN